MIKLKDFLGLHNFVNSLREVKIAYKSEVYGDDDIEWLMDKYVNSINIYPSVILVKLEDKEIDNDLYTETIIRKFKTES
jgi:hypothetical protein